MSEYILGKKLDKGVHFGRIYRVTDSANMLEKITNLANLPSVQLVEHLTHPNSWHRDTAKRLLIEQQDKSILNELNEIALTVSQDYHQINALWTLEGLNALSEPLLSLLISKASASNKLKAQVIELSTQLPKKQQLLFVETLIKQNMAQTSSYELAMSLAATLGQFKTTASDQLLVTLVSHWQKSSTIASLALTGLNGRESHFISLFSNNKSQKKLLSLISPPKAKEETETHLNKKDYQTYLRGKNISACWLWWLPRRKWSRVRLC